MNGFPDSFLAEYGEGRIEAISFAPNELEISYANVPIPKGTVIQTTGRLLRLNQVRPLDLQIMGKFTENRQKRKQRKRGKGKCSDCTYRQFCGRCL